MVELDHEEEFSFVKVENGGLTLHEDVVVTEHNVEVLSAVVPGLFLDGHLHLSVEGLEHEGV